ncbi:MAG: (Fe-S)-binding protein [Arhodomonas sp.]|nr:(Fe-S)-binding protein [Arhodomonas sp.]
MLLREWLRGDRLPAEERAALEAVTHESMQGCLGCRGCATQCPVHVDIPAMRARFLDAYHRRHRRPARDYLLAGMEHLLPALARLPRMANALIHARPGAGPGPAHGAARLPPLPSAHRWRAQADWPARHATALGLLRADPRAVAVVPDAFTRYLEPTVLDAALQAIQGTGHRPVVLPYQPSGKAQHVHGFMNAFRRSATRLGRHLAEVSAIGRPVVAIEPSVAVALEEHSQGAARSAISPNGWLHSHPCGGQPRYPDAATG